MAQADALFIDNGYPVTLTLYSNIPFDNTYKHHSFIYSGFKYQGSIIGRYTTKQSDFLEMQLMRTIAPFTKRNIYSRTLKPESYNFEQSNGIVTSLVLELDFADTNINYLKVEQVSAPDQNEWYYFITGINQINGNTYKLSLELDVIMTFGDDFMRGMKDIPVFTRRKHCFRVDSLGNFGSVDFATIESSFASLKPCIAEKKIDCGITGLGALNKINWLYFAYGDKFDNANYNYTHKNVNYPFIVGCIPLVDNVTITFYRGMMSSITKNVNIKDVIKKLIGAGNFKSAKISPYPPFADFTSTEVYFSNDVLHINFRNVQTLQDDATALIIKMICGDDEYIFEELYQGSSPVLENLMDTIIITQDTNNAFRYTPVNLLDVIQQQPSIDNSYDTNEYKVLFSPFRKYLLKSIYNGGYEIRPELLYCNTKYDSTSMMWSFVTITTNYPFDNTHYTFTSTQNKYNSILGMGNDNVINHNMPVGENALDYFAQNQSAEYYQGKTAQAVTNGLSIVGGVALIGGAVAGAVGSYGISAGASLKMALAGGTMIAGGIAGEVNISESIKAHQTDLLNRPDSIQNIGSSFAHDLAISYEGVAGDNNNYMFPSIVIMKCKDADIHSALDEYYNYGYEVNRCCYFNDELSTDIYDDSEIKADTHLFTRSLFNYIRIEDDITNKISSPLPYIVKQKFNQIFNNGITLWTFFGFNCPWKSDTMFEDEPYNPTKYLYKEEYDNAEFYNQDWD